MTADTAATETVTPFPLRTSGTKIVDGSGAEIRLRGVCVGGWLNMENFITGYPANESMMRKRVPDALADSIAFSSCTVRETLLEQLKEG